MGGCWSRLQGNKAQNQPPQPNDQQQYGQQQPFGQGQQPQNFNYSQQQQMGLGPQYGQNMGTQQQFNGQPQWGGQSSYSQLYPLDPPSSCKWSWVDYRTNDMTQNVPNCAIEAAPRCLVARMHMGQDIVLGTLDTGNCGFKTWHNNKEYYNTYQENIQVLVGSGRILQWTSSSNGAFVPNAVPGGIEMGERHFIGRVVKSNGQMVIGKIVMSRNGCLAVDSGEERIFHTYDILFFPN